MKLEVKISKIQEYEKIQEFILLWVIPTLKKIIKSKILKSKKNLLKYEDPKLINILIEGANSLTFFHSSVTNTIIITLNPNLFCTEKSAKLYDICAQINYGSLQYSACPIFTESFDYMAQYFWEFYDNYKMGVLPCP